MHKCPKKGLAYILNIARNRPGSDEDYANMKHVFAELGYETETHAHRNINAEVRIFITGHY